MDTLSVNEEFVSVQSEGPDVGTPAWFIRLAGCTLGCAFCDTRNVFRYERTPEELATNARKPYVVITGGEPLEQDIKPLIEALGRMGKVIAVETNGLYPLPETRFDVRVIVSPKPKARWRVHSNLCPTAYKLLVTEDLTGDIIARFLATGAPVYLQALWGDNNSFRRMLDFLDEYPVRVSFQWHKLYNIP